MEPITAIAASGLRARMESLDLVANNIANATTGGYKADREFYSLYVAPEAAGGESFSTMPVIERPWVDHSQGVLDRQCDHRRIQGRPRVLQPLRCPRSRRWRILLHHARDRAPLGGPFARRTAPYRQPARCRSLRHRFLCGQRTKRSSIYA